MMSSVSQPCASRHAMLVAVLVIAVLVFDRCAAGVKAMGVAISTPEPVEDVLVLDSFERERNHKLEAGIPRDEAKRDASSDELPQQGIGAMEIPSRQRRQLRDSSYSWGAEKKYSAAFTSDRGHTLGNKSVLVIKFLPAGSTCDGGCNPDVISDADLQQILDAGKTFISANSYGKASISVVDVVPSVLTISEGNFFATIDNAREAAYAAGYDFQNYDFDMIWKDSNGGSIGGSAIPGGRAQRFMFDGSTSSFANKIFPHEFAHNFGVGHAFEGAATYGDEYDMIGGGSGQTAHLSAGVKHRFLWITDDEVEMLSPSTFPVGDAPRIFKIRAHDTATANVGLAHDEVLAVRLETRFMQMPCPLGEQTWCPDWGDGFNGSNPWYSTTNDVDHYLYISYRANHSSGKAAAGASLHVLKYKADGWIDATNFVDVRDYTDSQDDAFLAPGETYVFDGDSSTAIKIKTLSAEAGLLTVEVQYVDGTAVQADYAVKNESHMCVSTITCGTTVELDLAMNGLTSMPRTDGKSLAVAKVGELHQTDVSMNLCRSAGAPTMSIYGYKEFPTSVLAYGSHPLIGATLTLPDFCDGATYPKTIRFSGTGVSWLDDRDLVFQAAEDWYVKGRKGKGRGDK